MDKHSLPRLGRRFRSPRRGIAVSVLALSLAVLAVEARAEAAGGAAGGPVKISVPGASTLSGSYLAARYAGRMRDMENGAAFYEEALIADPHNPELIERAFTLRVASGDVAGAAGLAAQMPARMDVNNLAALVVAARAFKAQDYAAARAAFLRTGRTQLAELSAVLGKAWALAGEGKPNDGVTQLDSLRNTDLDLGFADYHSGLILDLAGDETGARRLLESAYEADPSMMRLAEAYARVLARSGARPKAVEVVNTFINTVAPHPVMTRLAAELKTDAAIGPIVPNAAAGLSEALYDLGSAVARDGSEEIAAAYLQVALYLDPSSDLAALSLAELHERLSQPELAIAVFERIPADSPHAREAQIQIGLNYNDMKQVDDARRELSAVVARDPSDLDAVVALGSVLRSNDLFAEAVTAYTGGIDTLTRPDRRHWVLYYQRGICYERLKQWPQAEADFRKALELQPQQPLVLNYLGYSLVDMGKDLDEGLSMIRKAVELRPTDGYIVDSLGWAYYKLGRYEDAVTELERAVEMLPDDPVINDHLGDAYWRVGRRLEAKFQWAHARDMKPEAAALVEIQAKLANGLPPAPAPTKASAVTP